MISYNDAKKNLDNFTLFTKDDVEIEGFFTNARIDRSTLPEGIYAYDLREGDDGEICTIEDKVMVNHAGTFICDQKIDLGEEGRLELGDDKDMDYSF